MRPRILLLSLVGIAVALVVLSLADNLLVDLLWFSTLGYRQVFIITLGAQVAIFAIVWAVVLSQNLNPDILVMQPTQN